MGVSRVRGHWIPVVRICNEETEAEAPIWEESTSVLVVLGRLRGRFGLRVEDFGDVFDEGAARPIDKLDGEDLIEVGGELVRYVDPVALVGSLESVFEDGGQLMSQNIATKQVKIVTFRIGSEVFGVDVIKVSEVLQLPVVTRVPRAPEFVEGLAEVREGVVPVIDMRKRFSVEIAPGSAGERLLVVDLDGVRVGLVVDVVPGVEAVANEDVSRPPEFFKGLAGRYLEGIAKKGDRLIVLLNLDEILSSAENIELNAALEDLGTRC